jgi:protein farnesyltransferase/geranylgeranyltransferase type-1 subunit alpha
MGKYSEDPKWASVVPLIQEETVPTPLAQINYPDAYIEAMSYLRAIMADNEKSPRVLDLTADIINMSAAHYTVW